MTPPAALPRHPRDLARFSLGQALAYNGVIALCELTGLWRHPAALSGDLESMGFLDKAYWLFKSARPVRRAARGSGLEEFFSRHEPPETFLPEDFTPGVELSLSAVGDLMIHPYLARSSRSLYREVADLVFDADIAMGNLEFVVLDRSIPFDLDLAAGPAPAFDPAAFHAVGGGEMWTYDFLSAACNHSLDFGEAGVASTIAALRARGVAFHGLNESESDADRAAVLERRGVRIGVVSHTFGLNARRPPANRPSIVNRIRLNDPVARIDFSPLERQLRHCAAAGVDFVVAQLHWGMEFELYPRPEQIEVAHHIADLGVDAIIGHHPHVPQPVEYYRTARDPDRVVPIYYSLGNLTNPFLASHLCRSGVARIHLVKGARGDGSRRTYVQRAGMSAVEQVVARGRREIELRISAPG